jgi:hypothetical protein
MADAALVGEILSAPASCADAAEAVALCCACPLLDDSILARDPELVVTACGFKDVADVPLGQVFSFLSSSGRPSPTVPLEFFLVLYAQLQQRSREASRVFDACIGSRNTVADCGEYESSDASARVAFLEIQEAHQLLRKVVVLSALENPGSVNVLVQEAKDLPDRKWMTAIAGALTSATGGKIGAPGCYCKCVVSSKDAREGFKVKTGISRNSLTPAWHEQIKAPISSVEEVIRLEVWSSTGLKHSLISGAAIPVADICDASASERWLKLKTESGAFKGELKVCFCKFRTFFFARLFICYLLLRFLCFIF